jgi:hypothetical protein
MVDPCAEALLIICQGRVCSLQVRNNEEGTEEVTRKSDRGVTAFSIGSRE